jgi:hypothetical protein
MPNWCNNQLDVYGPADSITAFLLAAKTDQHDLSFANLFPCPQSLKDAVSGSDEIYYDIVHGDLSKVASYGWIPYEIKGDRDALLTFVANRHQYHIGKAIGIADLIKYNLETYGAKNWYDWCIKNWGTKWDIEGSGNRVGEESLSYNFSSAWSPPVEAFVKISESFPDLTFVIQYFESGACFSGVAEIRSGDVIDHEQWNIAEREALEDLASNPQYGFIAAEAQYLIECGYDGGFSGNQ